MHNIKQKILKFIISFSCLLLISSCDQVRNFSDFKNVLGKNVVDIAILLPLTGADTELSKEYAKMIKLGLSDGAKTKIRVTTYDSTNQEKLNASLDKIFDAGTDIVIGPVYSEATKTVVQKSKGKSTIFLSLSNNPVLADKNVYIYGHAPMRQLEQITNYFLDNKYQNFIALLPAGRYSSTVSKILNDMITNREGILSRVEFYSDSPKDMAKSVSIVSDNVDNLNESDLNLKQPVILVADDPVTLEILYRSAKHYNLDKKAIIAGDSRVDIDYTPPVDVTFTGSLNITNTNLAMRTTNAGIKHISYMHAVAYDAGKMVGDRVGSSYNRTNFLSQMNAPESFVGISGTIHFVDFIAQRKYDIVQKENGKYKTAAEKVER
jgi:hypothetical protein